MEEARPAGIVKHFRENADSFIDSRGGDGAVIDGAEAVRAFLQIAQVSILDVQLHPIAVAPWLGRHSRDFDRGIEFAEPP